MEQNPSAETMNSFTTQASELRNSSCETPSTSIIKRNDSKLHSLSLNNS